jgi:hypothetical protein
MQLVPRQEVLRQEVLRQEEPGQFESKLQACPALGPPAQVLRQSELKLQA